ncbi:imidazole glycerol phosphate synthase, glutamine amidotransferase subunit [Bacillus sp. FJAT-27225]|uniref:imidazole glycerol phosphate synthase subunit HisH n=1 Tax=Bacillus sp. FJAT-27225 TaxID=1743144 RepID=UPI00080C2FE8|nr:imidazole glycerol phosphate synthase subunit HisH [Bacillus sp. FJAT-27225]OCA88182.1 imidazole glycerol phosphate synthase, glutamine amidotransferase subunit [Bacillus sp. FJAT-27225]
MIGIIDYGMGNLFSVSKALERLGAGYFLSGNRAELADADALILPGVGSFRDAMFLLKSEGLADMLHGYAASGKPLLGICLGMQLLFEESEENGPTEGLGILPGKVERFSGLADDGTPYKVPHIGWNKLKFAKESPILAGLNEGHVYFVHSYFVKACNPEFLIAKADYNEEVAAVVGKGNIYGMQFHPEKSGPLGIQLLQNFLNLAEAAKAGPT